MEQVNDIIGQNSSISDDMPTLLEFQLKCFAVSQTNFWHSFNKTSLFIEPINTRDIPGFFLNRQDQAHAIREQVGEPNLKVQMDLYHAQIVEGDLSVKFKKYAPHVGHIQIASVPERHEPDEGEVNYAALFKLIDASGYDGWIGCEYRPRGVTEDGLGWLKTLTV